MPDSQSFAYLCVYGIGIGTALTASASKNFKRWLWAGIRFAGLGVILSGTRAVWVGMVAPLAAVTVLYWRNILRPAVVRFFWPLAIILVLFALSPFINRGLQYLRAGGVFEENFLARAQSIYNLSESSNAGRLVIWKDSAAFALRHPLGTGLNNFLVSVARPGPEEHKGYGELAEQKNERYNLPQKFITAHNLYLHIWVELGLVGLVAFAALWIAIAKQLWKFLRANRQASSIWVFTVAQAGLVFLWLGAAAFFDVTWYNDKALMFFFLELAVAGIVIRNYTPWKPETL
jgi:O-antigen ligase